MRIQAVAAIALTLTGTSQAWWDVGHKLVAAVATAKMKNAHSIEQVHNVLSYLDSLYNDEATEWEMGNYQAEGTSRPKQESSTLVQAATWPDVTKSFYNIQAFSGWHYVDLKYDPDNLGCDVGADVDAKSQMLTLSKEIPDKYKGRQTAHWYAHFALNFLVHMIGDVHQPFHAVARCIMHEGAPAGDLGGNRWYFTTPANESTQIHAWWDSGQTLWGNEFQAETEAKDPEYKEIAADLIAKYPLEKLAEMGYYTDTSREENRTRMEESIDSWLNESYVLGVESYEHAPLNGVMDQAYADEAHLIAESRVVMGGLRLAAVLDGLFAETDFPVYDATASCPATPEPQTETNADSSANTPEPRTETNAESSANTSEGESSDSGISVGALIGGIIGGVVVGAIVGALAMKTMGGKSGDKSEALESHTRLD